MPVSRPLRSFLEAYEECGSIVRAAEAAGMDRSAHYKAYERHEDYRAEFAAADQRYGDRLEGLVREAMTGALRDDTGIIRPPKSTAEARVLVELLRAAKPEKYRSNSTVEHTGAAGGPLELTVRFVKPE